MQKQCIEEQVCRSSDIVRQVRRSRVLLCKCEKAGYCAWYCWASVSKQGIAGHVR